MIGNSKRFRGKLASGQQTSDLPDDLRHYLSCFSPGFTGARMRNLDIMNDCTTGLYGLMTNYEGKNFCWIQPTRVKNRAPHVEYDLYIRRINKDARRGKLLPLTDIRVGADCVAQYEADGNWYRGLVVGEPMCDRWLVLFVDYGNVQRCSTDQMASTVHDKECDHFHAPLQAVLCHLYNITPSLPRYKCEIDARLETFYANHSNEFLELIVKKVRPDYVIDCDIFCCRNETPSSVDRLHFKHIGQPLVDAGIAAFSDPKAAHSVGTAPVIKSESKFGEDNEDRKHKVVKTELT